MPALFSRVSMSKMSGLVLALGFFSLTNNGWTQEELSPVEVARLSSEIWSKYAPVGKEVDAIAGDIVLRNHYVTAVIAQPLTTRHASMTVQQVGGAIIDLTTRNQPSDQLGAFYPSPRKFPYTEWTVTASENQVLQLPIGGTASGEFAAVEVKAPGNDSRPTVTTTYRLEYDESFLIVTTQFSNKSDTPLEIPLTDEFQMDGAQEWVEKSPDGLTKLFWAQDRFWNQAYGIGIPGVKFRAKSDSRTSTLQYNFNNQTVMTLLPGQEFDYTRFLFVGQNSLDIKADAQALEGHDVPSVQVRVVSEDGGIGDVELHFKQNKVAYGSGRTDENGILKTAMPAGNYTVSVKALGLDVAKELRFQQDALDGAFQELRVEDYRPGKVMATINDEQGQPVPCKVEFVARDTTQQPDFGPITGSYSVRNLRYAPQGRFQQILPVGEYDVIISHGPEYDAIFSELVIKPAQTVELKGTLTRTVKTSGWVSADFHSHSSPSGDNTASPLGRVLNHVCEQLEFVPRTEHNRIDTYDPIISELGLGGHFKSAPGIELTGLPLPINHQNGFPLVHHPLTQDGGAPLPDVVPATQIERLTLWDNRSEKMVQVNHPDLGWMFYHQTAPDEPGLNHQAMLPFVKVIEVHPINCILQRTPKTQRNGLEYNNTMFGWLQLLNQGYRITGVVNSDSHDNFHGTGWLRNYVHSSTDDPAQIDPLEIVKSTKQGQVVMTNGPFLEVQIAESAMGQTVTPGQDLVAPSGKLKVMVRVQTPNWFDIDRVFLLVNGRIPAGYDFTREGTPEKFRNAGPVKYEESLDLQIERDSHIIVVAAGVKSTLSRVMGKQWGSVTPIAISNPIYIDKDSGGFQPNKDTLDHPLPQKSVPRKI